MTPYTPAAWTFSSEHGLGATRSTSIQTSGAVVDRRFLAGQIPRLIGGLEALQMFLGKLWTLPVRLSLIPRESRHRLQWLQCLLHFLLRDNPIDYIFLQAKSSQPVMDGNLSSEGLAGFDYDPRNPQYPYGRVTYPIPIAGDASRRSASTIKRSTTPLQIPSYDQPISQLSSQQPQAQAYIPDWRLERQVQSQLGYQFDESYPSDPTYTQQYLAAGYTMPYQTSPTDYVSTQGQYDSTLAVGGSYVPMTSHLDGGIPFDFQDFSNELLYPIGNGLPDMTLAQQNLSNSPTDTSLEVRSLSSSDNGWIELPRHSFDGAGSYQTPQLGAIFNPEETLHGRTFSDSSCSDVEQQSRHSWSSWVDVPQHAIGSPSSDSMGEMDPREFRHDYTDQGSLSPYIKQEKQPQPKL
ncbi:hypothetical protein ABVK25_000765 [Lepraria finkii]|uniref:Uncharacterized protein n=1 Tax=Lepraria finkii TaxID=1340010 RepID=A0ABR4BNT3_9LECA